MRVLALETASPAGGEALATAGVGGGAFVLGSRTVAPYGVRTTLSKLGPDGAEVWQVRAPAPAAGLRASAPAPLAIAADSSGGAYASFLLDGEVVVLRYAADGSEAWRVSFPEADAYRGTDGAELVSDAAGVYFGAAGHVSSDFPDAEFAYVVRLSAAGQEEWRRTFEPADDLPGGVFFSVLAYRPGGVYLVGARALFALGADGTEAWRAGTGGHRAVGSPDGGLITLSTNPRRLRAYAADGTAAWETALAPPFSLFTLHLAAGEAGQVYLAGTAVVADGEEQGVGLQAFTPDGLPRWDRFYAAEGRAEVYAIYADAGGVAVAGAVRGPDGTLALRYGADGTLDWADERDTPGPSALTALYGTGGAIGAVGTASVDGPRAARYGYSASGTPLWSYLEAGAAASLDAAATLHADADGVWLAGRSGDGSTTDFSVTRYARNGDGRRTVTLDGAAFGLPSDSTGEALASAPDGSALLVGGQIAGKPVAVRTTPQDLVGWQLAYESGIGAGRGRVVSIAPDGTGGAYLGIEAEAEQVFENSTNTEAVVVRVGAGGEVLWAMTRGGPYRDRAVEVLPTPYGVAVVTVEIPDEQAEIHTVIAAYAPDGSTLWTTSYGEAEGSIALHAGADADGGVRLFASRGSLSYLVAFDADGALAWERSLGQGGELPQGPPVAMAVGDDGTVTALGTVAGASGEPDGYSGPAAYRVDPDGALEWVTPLGHATPLALSVAATGEVAALVRDPGTAAFYAAALDAEGELRWTATVPAGEWALPVLSGERPLYRVPLVALVPDGGLYVTQNARALQPISLYTDAWVSEVVEVRRYGALGLLSDAGPGLADTTFEAYAPYPNPSRGAAQVRLSVIAPERGEVAVEVFDVLGRRVQAQRHTLAPGPNEVVLGERPLSAGPYVVRVRSPWGVAVHRLTRID